MKKKYHDRCKGVTKSGEPCKLDARRGSDYCNNHRKQEKSQ